MKGPWGCPRPLGDNGECMNTRGLSKLPGAEGQGRVLTLCLPARLSGSGPVTQGPRGCLESCLSRAHGLRPSLSLRGAVLGWGLCISPHPQSPSWAHAPSWTLLKSGL